MHLRRAAGCVLLRELHLNAHDAKLELDLRTENWMRAMHDQCMSLKFNENAPRARRRCTGAGTTAVEMKNLPHFFLHKYRYQTMKTSNQFS